MKLYYNPRSRATIARWMIEECGADYEVVHVDFEAGDNKTPDFLAINPAGKLPVLVDGDLRMYENTAICLYLAERFPEANLAPAISDPLRGRYLTLCVYSTSQLEPAMGDVLLKQETSPHRGWTSWEAVLDLLTRELGEGPYLLGERFSTADLLIAAQFSWFRMFGNELPAPLSDYVDRMVSRPAAAAIVPGA